jgi:hypothetical protein
MNAADELAQLYAQWRTLTEQEGASIRQGQWPEVETCQAAKSRLQPRILELSATLEPVLLEARFHRVVDDLVQLERENADLIVAQRADADRQVGEFDRARRSLRQLQRHYRPAAGQNWHSYS